MKISVGTLRRVIREALEEQGWVPGRWYPGSGEPVDADDIDKMAHGGFHGNESLEEEEGIEEA